MSGLGELPVSSKMKPQAPLMVVLSAVCGVLCRRVWVLVLVCNVRLLRVCVCVVCGAAWNAEEKKLYVHYAYVCNGKTPACSTHAGVFRVHTKT